MDHPHDLHKSNAAGAPDLMLLAERGRAIETFDGIVRLLLAHEQRHAPRINGHHVMDAAWRVRKLSPLFAAVDIDACLRRIEHGYAARRAVEEARRG